MELKLNSMGATDDNGDGSDELHVDMPADVISLYSTICGLFDDEFISIRVPKCAHLRATAVLAALLIHLQIVMVTGENFHSASRAAVRAPSSWLRRLASVAAKVGNVARHLFSVADAEFLYVKDTLLKYKSFLKVRKHCSTTRSNT